MTPPYSMEQAQYLLNMFKNVVGTEFEEKGVLVEDIAIVPFDQASRQRFILYYMVMAGQAQDIVLQEYKGFLFDIVLLAHNAAGEVVHKSLAEFLGPSSASFPEDDLAGSFPRTEELCSGKV